MLNYYLLGGLIAVYLITTMVNGWLHDSTAELATDVRERIFAAGTKPAWLWRALEFAGFALILAAMFAPQMTLFSNASHRILAIAGGLLLFCLSNSASAWFTNAVYRREAPGTKSSNTAKRAAMLITLAEILLMAAVAWIVYTRIDWSGQKKGTDEVAETAPKDTAKWIDENEALKILSALPKDYVQGLVEGGSIRTKTENGKTKYNARDVESYKNKKPDVIPD